MQFKYEGIKIGADPELFLTNKDGKFISAVGLIGGSKEKPKKIDKKGHAVQEDNVMVEYNIPPAVKVADFIKSHEVVLEWLRGNPKLKGLELNFSASAEFDPEQLDTPQAQVFGCEPDYNAWLMEVNPAIKSKGVRLRTAGGHIHVGYHKADIENQVALIRAMDLFLGVPSIILDPDKRRRERYGKAGAFRPKEYGVEFRTPSNFWIRDRETMEWAFNNTQAAVKFLNDGGTIADDLGKSIQNTINKGDEAKARELCKEYQVAGV